MDRLERIAAIKKHAPGTKYVILDQHGRFWKMNDRGYSEDRDQAKVFTQAEIVERLENGGLMDKTIETVQ